MALDPDKVFSTYGFGKSPKEIFFDEEEAIAQLIQNGIIFVNYSTGLYVNCSDVFAWALAEGEHINDEADLKDLYEYAMTYHTYGSTIWCCIRRGEKPQASVAKRMKEVGAWPPIIDTLKNNRYDEYISQKHASNTTT